MEKKLSAKNGKSAKQVINKEKRLSATRDPGIGSSALLSNIRPKSKTGIEDVLARLSEVGTVGLIIDRATEVIGDRKEAMRWLGTPVRGLDFATPISLLATVEGQMRVKDILGQMEHGIW